MSEAIAKVRVRGPGLFVTEADEAAEALAGRDLLGMPLSETMNEPEYGRALHVIGRSVSSGIRASDVVIAADGTIGRMVVEPTADGAEVTFARLGAAIQVLTGPDLIMGKANEAWHALAGQVEYLHLAARDVFPSFGPAQDLIRWVMLTGNTTAIRLNGGKLTVARIGWDQVMTHFRPDAAPQSDVRPAPLALPSPRGQPVRT